MDVDVESVVGFQQQGGLYAGGREERLREVGGDGRGHDFPDLGEPRDGVVVLLGVVVAGDPVGGHVASEGELRPFFADDEIDEFRLLRKFVAESQPVVEEAEADGHRTARGGLAQRHEQFVVMLPDACLLTPDRCPVRIGLGPCDLLDDEPAAQRTACMERIRRRAEIGREVAFLLVGAEVESEAAGVEDLLALVFQGVGRYAVSGDGERHFQIPVRGAELLRRGGEERQHESEGAKKSFHGASC